MRKTLTQIKIMREGGAILKETFSKVLSAVDIDVATEKLNDIALENVRKSGAEPSFLGYQGYPAAICTSINEEVVHGIPSKRKLKNGDLLSIDIGVFYKGLHTDAAITVPVGNISEEDQILLNAGKSVLKKALFQVCTKKTVGDIGYATLKEAERYGYTVVRDMTGHGVGKNLHEDPSIPNFGDPKTGSVLQEGQTLAIEPMINKGGFGVTISEDGWTVRTLDGEKSVHFESTVLVTKKGYEDLTAIKA